MSEYPTVVSEVETLKLVLNGRSLARYGDGEFNLCAGGSIPCQRFDTVLRERLQGILKASGECLVGIPNLHSPTPKAEFWKKYHGVAPLLADRPYVSAFVSRPDSAPWIDTSEYWEALEGLWTGRPGVTLVRGSRRSLILDDICDAPYVREIHGPSVDAWERYDALLDQVADASKAPGWLTVLCLGPTATVLAVDLCAMGHQAVDLGHVGMFYRKHLAGAPMVVTQADKDAGLLV